MAILKHTYKVAITRTNIGYERRHYAWALTSHGADRAA